MSDFVSPLRSLVSRPHIFQPSRIIAAAQTFVQVEASSGIVLMLGALVGLIWINSPLSGSYLDLLHSHVAIETALFSIEEDIHGLVNDGLMTVFFFVVGLEIKRELVHGEMSDVRRAILPAIAALGGMAGPALIYLAFNIGGPGSRGWGVPMATDIAFSLGVLSLLGTRVPFSVKVFLLALAIADDIGGVLVIALFYTSDLNFQALGIAFALLAVIVTLNRTGVREVNVYLALGVALWVATFESGAHATLSGVALGLITPARSLYDPKDYPRTAAGLLGDFQHSLMVEDQDAQQSLLAQTEDLSRGTEAPLDRLGRALHPWVSYAVVPLFALVNAGVKINGDVIREASSSSVAFGVAIGLVLGKPVGIFAFTWLSVRLRLCELPSGSNWGHILGVGFLGGIGFTVSLLIASLAFEEALLIDEAKLGILMASVLAGVVGYVFLRLVEAKASRAVATATPQRVDESAILIPD